MEVNEMYGFIKLARTEFGMLLSDLEEYENKKIRACIMKYANMTENDFELQCLAENLKEVYEERMAS